MIEKGEEQMRTVVVILRVSDLDFRIKTCILVNVIAQKTEYGGEVRERTAKLMNKLGSPRMTAAKRIL